MKLQWRAGEFCLSQVYYQTARGNKALYTVNKASVGGESWYTLYSGKEWVWQSRRIGEVRRLAQYLEDKDEGDGVRV